MRNWVVELVSNRPLDLPYPQCTSHHSPIFKYSYKEKEIIELKKKQKKNGSGPGFKETFGSPISAMHFWALTHLQTVMCPSIEECQSVPVSKRTWSLYATTTKHLNLFFRFSHIWTYFMLTSLIVCLQHFGSLLFWTNDAQISKQLQYVVRITMTLRLFPSLPDHTTKTVCSTEIKHAGLHDSQNKANKKDQKSNKPQLLISCKTVTKQSLETRLEKKC